ncbi:MAG: enoyl-CoA hydratase/isomerase family protein [Lutibacter sp.]
MSNGSLYTNIQNNIATVQFFHPAGNSMPLELLNRLANTFKKLSDNENVHVIILKSEKNRAFCGGASFKELINISNLEEGKTFFNGFASVINAMRTCSQLIIGSIQGKAVGGGVGLAAACDYCLATEAAEIKLSEFSIGIGPFVIEPVVKRKMGISGLAELTLDPNHWKTAYWAKQKGLYAKVFETQKELEDEVANLALNLAGYNLEATRAMKKIFWEGTENWDTLLKERAEISGQLVLSNFTKKALEKFKK